MTSVATQPGTTSAPDGATGADGRDGDHPISADRRSAPASTARERDADGGEETDGHQGADGGEDNDGHQGTDGPAGNRRGFFRRVLLVLTALLSTTVVVVTTAGWFVLTFYDSQIERETIAPPPEITVTRPPPAAVGTETWLLVGSDVRTGSDAAEVGGARSDTMMIAHLAADGATDVVSIPRDLRVPIPAWTDEDGDRHRARNDRINAAFSAGGPALLVATLEQVAGLRIDHYAEIDFGGFQEMTSAIGGIDVCLRASPFVEAHTLANGRRVRSTNLNDPSSGFVGQPGTNHLIGDNALAFVRQRHGFADGDLSRIRRQQTFLAAMFREVTSSDVLLRPGKLAAFLGAVTRSVVLDDDTGFVQLRALADRMRAMTTGAVRFSTVPIIGQVSEPAFYFLYDSDEMHRFFRAITGQEGPSEQGGLSEQDGAPGGTGTPAVPLPSPQLPPAGAPADATGTPVQPGAATSATAAGVATTEATVTGVPTTEAPTTEAPTTEAAATEATVTGVPTAGVPTTGAPTTEAAATRTALAVAGAPVAFPAAGTTTAVSPTAGTPTAGTPAADASPTASPAAGGTGAPPVTAAASCIY